jgi:hypothetical protein
VNGAGDPASFFARGSSRAANLSNQGIFNMRKGIRITLDDATEHALHDMARRESRPVANAAAYLIKLGLAAKRAEQRRDTDHHDAQR